MCEDSGIQILYDENGMPTNNGRRCPCQDQKVAKGLTDMFGNQEFLRNSVSLTLDTYTTGNRPPEIARAKAMIQKYLDLLEIDDDTHYKSAAILGQSGAGKTHLLCAVGNHLRKIGQESLYLPYTESMSEFKAIIRDPQKNLDDVLKKIKRANVLLWDDLFKGRAQPTDFEVTTVYDILNFRYMNHKPTVFTSEWSIDDISELDQAIGGRINQMCGAYVMEFPLDKRFNYRFRGR